VTPHKSFKDIRSAKVKPFISAVIVQQITFFQICLCWKLGTFIHEWVLSYLSPGKISLHDYIVQGRREEEY